MQNTVSADANLILAASDGLGALYLGGRDAANSIDFLLQNRIECVLTVASKFDFAHRNFSHKKVHAFDEEDYDLAQHFDECFKFISEHRSQNKNVLVHCMAGRSRSAAIVIGYLKYEQQYVNFDDAHLFVQSKRSIRVNSGFVAQLQRLFLT